MIEDSDQTRGLVESVLHALANHVQLELVGGGSKQFYGRAAVGERLELAGHRGVLTYEPRELLLTARAGTPVSEITEMLANEGQMLPFEPPSFGTRATLGGTLACGLSGPRRPYAGSMRDFVLGARLINGRGEVLRFGGEVMKNVAGYDASRLMAGAMGTLGLVLDISLKVLPLPEQEITLSRESDARQAIEEFNRWAGQPLPLSAACFDGQRLWVRLSGSGKAVGAACHRIGGEAQAQGARFWNALCEYRLAFFGQEQPLWRLAVPSSAPPLQIAGKQFIDWGGAQRWLLSESDPGQIRKAVEAAGGHACLFRGGDRSQQVFHPLPQQLLNLHQRLKQTFDPRGIFNPGRLYREL